MKRYLVEFAMGADLHGGDMTKAAEKAVKNAISNCCMCGIEEILGITNPADRLHVHIKIGCPRPEKINRNAVLSLIPFGSRDIEITTGGMCLPGLHVDALGEGSDITLVIAGLTVYIKEKGE